MENSAFVVSGNTCTIIHNSEMFTITDTHMNYNRIIKLLNSGKFKKAVSKIDISKNLTKFGKGKIKVIDGVVYYGESVLSNGATKHLLACIEKGQDYRSLINFIDNLMENPSYRAVQELYTFLERSNVPITSNGTFLVYKKVRTDYLDIHSGTMDNTPGNVLTMARNMVDENSNNTCSAGLHVCAYSYLKSFGGSNSRIVICEVNPRDVVSIPVDYNSAKMRTCEYKVLKDVTDRVNTDGDILNDFEGI